MASFPAEKEEHVKENMVNWWYLEQDNLASTFQKKEKQTTNAGLLQQQKEKKNQVEIKGLKKKTSFPFCVGLACVNARLTSFQVALYS